MCAPLQKSCLTNDQLPIDEVLPEVAENLRPSSAGNSSVRNKTIVLEAPPGAGKSTRLPLWLLTQPQLVQKQIILIQPRRVAAIGIANYLAAQLNEKPGETVGYHVRGDRKAGKNTRLLIVTDGMFTRMLQQDPELQEVDLLIFDEFHERNLHCDLGLALSLEALELRDDLKLMVMSATLPAERLARWLSNYVSNVATVSSAGRAFPVDLHYRPPQQIQDWLAHTVDVIQEAIGYAEHGVLVFLPGIREIRNVAERLKLPAGVALQQLFGGLGLEQQRQVLSKNAPGSRVILSTNLAETSLTIPGIDVVVDSGRERRARYLPKYQFTQLQTRMIAQSSAIQRAGRAGRTGPGHCFRLWQESQWQSLAEYPPAAIEQEDLSSLTLECLNWGAAISDLAWFTPPAPRLVEAALEKLEDLGAIEHQGAGLTTIGLTAKGRRLQRYGCEPELAALLDSVVGARAGGQPGSVKNQQKQLKPGCVNTLKHATLLVAWQEERECREPGLLPELMQQVVDFPAKYPRTHRRWQFWLRKCGLRQGQDTDLQKGHVSGALLAELIITSLPWTLAKKTGNNEFKLATGVALRWRGNPVHDDYLAVLNLSLREGEAGGVVQQAVGVTREQINAQKMHYTEQNTAKWKSKSGGLTRVCKTVWGKLELDEKEIAGAVTIEERIAAFIDYLRNEPNKLEKALQRSDSLLNRVRIWHVIADQDTAHRRQNWENEALEKSLEDWAGAYFSGLRTLAELERWDPTEALKARFTQDYGFEALQRLDRELPLKWEAPSGRQHKVRYTAANNDVSAQVSLKLQEVFGAPETPRLGGGKLPLILELLSPAGRPLHRTADLASFWQNAWPEVRKEMRGRYPKHPWPDDPTQAQATHLTKAMAKRNT